MALLVKDQIQDFVFDILTRSNIEEFRIIGKDTEGREYVRFDDPSHNPNDPNHAYIYPNLALARDKKFIEILEEIKTEFENGYRNFRS